MRKGLVYNHGRFAGVIEEHSDGSFFFTYDAEYVSDSATFAISLTLPKTSTPYHSNVLFPFFYGLLAEGTTRSLQCRLLRIDENDFFGLLLATAGDTVGSVTVVEDI